MSTSTVIRRHANHIQSSRPASGQSEEGDASELRARFEQVAAAALAHAETLRVVECFPPAEWEDSFDEYAGKLAQVREAGDRLHPVSLRNRDEELSGEALIREAMELFAA